MDINKVLFLSQEIAPYVEESAMSVICRDLPQAMQEQGVEVRIFMPKYGAVNERRNQLHEVKRFSGINLIIDDTDHPLIIKVATLQPSRLSVYFIYSDDYFTKNVTKELELTTDEAQNDERSIFFTRGTLETVKLMRWVPSVIVCSGWVTALAPLYIKKHYNDDPSYRDTKVVYALYGGDTCADLGEDLWRKLKYDHFSDKALKALHSKKGDILSLTQIALNYSDAVIQCTPDVSPEILDLVRQSGLPFLPYADGDIDHVTRRYLDFLGTLDTTAG